MARSVLRIVSWAMAMALAPAAAGCVFQDWKETPGVPDSGPYDPGAWDWGGRDVPGDGYAPELFEDAWPDPGFDFDTATDIALRDVAIDVEPGDGPTDPGVIDVVSDPGGEVVGPCALPPAPVYVNFDVSGFPTGGGMPPWGEGVLDGDGVLTAVEATRSGQRFVFEMADASTVTVDTNLPAEESIPFAVGDAVHLYAKQDTPWWRDLVLVLWDASGAPRFAYQDASSLNETTAWFDCGAVTGRLCPVMRALPDACPFVDGECGKRQSPPVDLLLFGGVSSSEVPPALRQGEGAFSPTHPNLWYHVFEAYRMEPGTYQCVDYPTQWLRAVIRLGLPVTPDCDVAKIGFTQDNPSAFEFYEICLPAGDAAAVDAVKAVDPSLYCGVAGHFAKCDTIGEVGCHGDLSFTGGTKSIDDATWERLCALSLKKVVTGFGGGYWL